MRPQTAGFRAGFKGLSWVSSSYHFCPGSRRNEARAGKAKVVVTAPAYPATWPTSFSPSSVSRIHLSHCGSMCAAYYLLRYLPGGICYVSACSNSDRNGHFVTMRWQKRGYDSRSTFKAISREASKFVPGFRSLLSQGFSSCRPRSRMEPGVIPFVCL